MTWKTRTYYATIYPMNTNPAELMPKLFTNSEIMILDFNQIPLSFPKYKNIKLYFENSNRLGLDPKLPENRQKFNNDFLYNSGKRYLISQYAEDRIEMLKGSKIAQEGRTIHLGIDIFSKDLENVYAPYDGQVVRAGKEAGSHSFGHFLILQPNTSTFPHYIFLGHLSKRLPAIGAVKRGEIIAQLGDFIDEENGGWSRHLHVQLLEKLPDDDSLPPGYSSKKNLEENKVRFPDPSFLVFN